MNNQVDVTLSVMIDNAVLEYEKATNEVMRKYGISVDLAEIALEKCLLNLKNKKLSLYASAMRAIQIQEKVTASKTESLKPKKEE